MTAPRQAVEPQAHYPAGGPPLTPYVTAFPSDYWCAAWSLLLDSVAGRVTEHLSARGIPSILLKGAAIATWLYDEGEGRTYRDVDLLVPPSQFGDAVDALAELGYVNSLAGAAVCELGPNEVELGGREGVCIDLHHRIIGMPDANRAWELLARDTEVLELRGRSLRVLGPAARAVHLALHALQGGPADSKAVADLARGVSRLPLETWREAASLADQLGAGPAFGAGLRLVGAGEVLADQLALRRVVTTDLVMRARSDPPEAFVFQQLSQLSGFGPRAALLARKLFPTSAYLRAHYPAAARGRSGPFQARICRLASVGRRVPGAYLAWRRAKRDVRLITAATRTSLR